jgi:hypothetical protein
LPSSASRRQTKDASNCLSRAVLNVPISPIQFRVRPQGWPSILTLLPALIKQLHYFTHADGLVVVVDSDDSVVDHPIQGECPSADLGCRICKVETVITTTLSHVTPINGRASLRFAVGLAVPSLEAWCRCGLDPHVSEATWVNARASGEPPPYDRKSLKRELYGTDRPSLDLESARMREETLRLALDLGSLRLLFPAGFGALDRALQTWVR